MKWLSTSIKAKLMFIIAILLVGAVGALGIFAFIQSTRTVQSEVETALDLLVREGVKVVERSMQAEINIVETMARREELKSMDWEKQQPVLAQEETELDFLGLGIVYPDGYTRYPDGARAELGDRGYVQEAFAGTSNFSDVIISRVIGQPVVMVATPIRNEGEIVGVLIARSDGNALSRIIDDMGFGEQGYAFMLNSEGNVIAHADGSLVMDQVNFLEMGGRDEAMEELAGLAERMVAGEEGFGVFNYDGEVQYMSFFPVPGTPWSMAVAALEEDVQAGANFMGRMITLGGFLVLIIGLGIAFFAGNSIAQPLQAVSGYTNKMSSGDFSFSLNPGLLKRSDEIGILARGFSTMQQSIGEMVGQVTERSEGVFKSAEEMTRIIEEVSTGAENQAGSVEELTATMEEMGSSIQEVSDNIQENSSYADNVSGAVIEMEKSFQEVVGNVEETSGEVKSINSSMQQIEEGIEESALETRGGEEAAKQTVEVARKGQEHVRETIEKMEAINSTVQKQAEGAQKLGSSAEQIGEIIDLINDISEQTNLLALNASIEAARAGEHGRGFAVVAGAIGELATKSQEATGDISSLIKGIQEEVNEAVNNSKDGSERAQDGLKLTRETGDIFDKIHGAVTTIADKASFVAEKISSQSEEVRRVTGATEKGVSLLESISQLTNVQSAKTEEVVNMVEKMSELSRDVAAASEEQSASTDEIVKSVENVSGIATQNASAGEEMATASHELKESAGKMLELAKKFTVAAE